MNVQEWQVPIRATWHKSNTLVELAYDFDGVELVLIEEETRQRWHVEFHDVAGVKVITEDFMEWSIVQIPPDGGFFEMTESPWIAALGLTETNDRDLPHHYLICCRSELIEIVAYEVAFSPD